MSRIMVRMAKDDFYALQIANGMESAGAVVFSITYNERERFFVWAKVESDEQISSVDNAIGKELS